MKKHHILRVLVSIVLLTTPLAAQKFYPDDPLAAEPAPFGVESANYRELNWLYEIVQNTFSDPGQRQPPSGIIPAEGVNTLGEVLDGPWFVNRHAKKRLTTDELLRGAGDQDPPSRNGPWRVLTVRKYGVRPGMLIHDADNTLYLLRFDPPGHPEMATGAGMIGSRLYYAMGYWVPETHLVRFNRAQLVAAPEGEDINAVGKSGRLVEEDIDLFLEKVPQERNGEYRAVAIKAPKGAILVGPYQFYGTRSDDPNDIVPHEHRRDLRGMYVISAWVNNDWVSGVQSQDALIEENDIFHFRHYLVDFFNILGAGFEKVKHAREGYEPMFDFGKTAANFAGFGLYTPKWERASYFGVRSAGRFESKTFNPATWTPNFTPAALANHLPDDDYWATKLVLSFTDDDIRTIVKVAEYSDPRVEEWIANALIERRDKIGRHFLQGVLPLDNFSVEGEELKFDDLAVVHGYRSPADYSVEWYEFRNATNDLNKLLNENSFKIPQRAKEAEDGSYYAARISGDTPGKTLTVYLRKENTQFVVVGIDRGWPGKVIAQQKQVAGEAIIKRYGELTARQKELFDSYAADYNKKTGFNLTTEQAFGGLTPSEHTTFDAVTHALSKSKLTDKDGNSLGVALDLVTSIERIAGQYYGREGDEQFRLYVKLRPDTRKVLEEAKEFEPDQENTVYHVGYPQSFRQAGKVPTIQFSVSEDGLRADIDVDYRSSKIPEALFNGHLTAANSDVRAGNNYRSHTNRWAGLVNWWQSVFGNLPRQPTDVQPDMLVTKPPEIPTPLPPNRPAGAQVKEVWEASQEFLTDWLVRRNYDEALEWVSDDALACVRMEEGADPRQLPPAEVRQELRRIMKTLSEEMGRFDNLTEAIDAVVPWRKAFRVVKQPFEGDFSIVEAPDEFAEFFKCKSRSKKGQEASLMGENLTYGTYYGSVFRFKVGSNSRGGVLGCLWAKEVGNWRIVAWEVLDQ